MTPEELKKLEMEMRLAIANAHFLLKELHLELEKARVIRITLEAKLNNGKRNG